MPSRIFLAVTAAMLLATTRSTAGAAHVWRAERLPLGGDRLTGGGGTRATMSVSVDTDANLLSLDFETGDKDATPRVVKIVGPPRDAHDDGVRLARPAGSRGHAEWKFPESDQAAILAGRMLVAIDEPGDDHALHGRIERLADDTSAAASTTTLTLIALGFAVLAVLVVATQRRREPV